ncbi:MAG: carbohydrate porin [Mariprofundaceae bacterium]
MFKKRWAVALLLLGLAMPLPVAAFDLADGISLEVGSTIIGQGTTQNNDEIDKPVTASVDVILDAEVGAGTFHLYLEGASTADISASSLVANANTDAGTAANSDGEGRIQITEAFYTLEIDALAVTAGLIDLTGFADATTTANDEGTQFLALPLYGNSSIAFPDYTAALVFNYGVEDKLQWTLLLANAYGLGDNESADYVDLLKFGENESGLSKGLFTLVEARVPGAVGITTGAWFSSSELERFDGLGTDSSTYGLYANLDGLLSNVSWSARVGWNSGKETHETNGFASLSVEYPLGENAVGAGLAYQNLSNSFREVADVAPTVTENPTLVELYYRWQATDWLTVSPDVQYWVNPNGLRAGGDGAVNDAVFVYGLRVQVSL